MKYRCRICRKPLKSSKRRYCSRRCVALRTLNGHGTIIGVLGVKGMHPEWTLRRIAEEVGVSHQRVAYILKSAIDYQTLIVLKP